MAKSVLSKTEPKHLPGSNTGPSIRAVLVQALDRRRACTPLRRNLDFEELEAVNNRDGGEK